MCHSKTESLHFYKYLCQKIGSVEVVRARRLLYIYRDLKTSRVWPPLTQITSGSKGEGLHLEGSDLDVMFVISVFVVYESEKDAVQDCSWIHPIVLVMDNEDTQPCFTHLQVYTDYKNIPYSIKQMLQQHRGQNLLSSQLYMSHNLRMAQNYIDPSINKIHGPCISDSNDQIDSAYCLKCDQWLALAQPWISRPRLIWPSPELISKITSCGIHIFLSSETLQDYRRFPYEITKSVCDNTTLMKTILDHDFFRIESRIINIPSMHKTLLYHCKTELSRCLLALSIANAYQRIPIVLPRKNKPNNKQQYKNYKHNLSQLLVGLQSDAVSGWLKLASFFYVHKNYLTSIDIINYTLSKCTDDSAVPNITLKQRQKLKLISLLRHYQIHLSYLKYNHLSSLWN
ncbi:unnamed protein product [Mytilus coruscus]|uniref:Mab-21-like HhH/H2TH-like domain-containing protein n=1 Tax=Mytilus coruscus TaxID=42192 RepID=A0A6J8AAJ5_MYTCO|nr:unnamed protein product [Mytilus coruscus]